MTTPQTDFRKQGFVSLWVGTFPSVEAAEAYFGIPDEIGIYLPPEAFAADFGLGDIPPEALEVNFERLLPRPLADLLKDATFGGSFLDGATEAAGRQGVRDVQGVALLYDFDNRGGPGCDRQSGPVRFVGAFPYIPVSPEADLRPFHDLARSLGYLAGAALAVIMALEAMCIPRRRAGESSHVSARELCDHLLECRGPDSAAFLGELGLRRSEDVGRVMYGLIEAGLSRCQEGESEADFQGLFALD